MTTQTSSDATIGPQPTGQESRVLLYRLGSLGDTLVALPAMNLVARSFPNAERRMLTNFPVSSKAAPAAAILAHTGLVHGYFRYATGTRNLLGLAKLILQIRSWRPDVLVYLAAARGTAVARRDVRFFRLCGIKKIVGAPLTEDMQKHRWLRETDALEPEAKRLTRNLAVLGEGHLDDPRSWSLSLTADEWARADEVLAPVKGSVPIAVSVGTKMQSKDWGRENWRALLAQVARLYPAYSLVLVGSPEESEASSFAAGGWSEFSRSPVVNLCGQLSPRESAAVIAHARIFLGHDSGPMHLAAAVQVPCVAVFSARNKPRVWFPYGPKHRVLYHKVDCYGCNLPTCVVEQKKCINSITVEEVLGEVRSLLEEPQSTIARVEGTA